MRVETAMSLTIEVRCLITTIIHAGLVLAYNIGMLARFNIRDTRAYSAIPAYGWFLAAVPVLLICTVACGRESARPVLPTAIITTTEPVTIAPTVTEPPPPAPTVTRAVVETITPSPTADGCRFDYFFQPVPESCPAGPPVISAAAEQPFEGGVMIWLAETNSIFVFFSDGRWQRFEDSWSEGEPESDPAITPPEGRFQPIRGFGKLWRETPALRETLGWALGVELGFESRFQEPMRGRDQPPLTYLLTYNGQVFGLVERALDQGDWVLAADNR